MALTRRAVIDARSRDARSAGNAGAVVTAHLRSSGDDTVVSVDTDLKVSGRRTGWEPVVRVQAVWRVVLAQLSDVQGRVRL